MIPPVYGTHRKVSLPLEPKELYNAMRGATSVDLHTEAKPMADPSSHEDPKKLWLHVKTGCHYKILHHGLNEKDLKPVVIYQSYDGTGPVWVRTAEEFFDGRFRNWE